MRSRQGQGTSVGTAPAQGACGPQAEVGRERLSKDNQQPAEPRRGAEGLGAAKLGGAGGHLQGRGPGPLSRRQGGKGPGVREGPGRGRPGRVGAAPPALTTSEPKGFGRAPRLALLLRDQTLVLCLKAALTLQGRTGRVRPPGRPAQWQSGRGVAASGAGSDKRPQDQEQGEGRVWGLRSPLWLAPRQYRRCGPVCRPRRGTSGWAWPLTVWTGDGDTAVSRKGAVAGDQTGGANTQTPAWTAIGGPACPVVCITGPPSTGRLPSQPHPLPAPPPRLLPAWPSPLKTGWRGACFCPVPTRPPKTFPHDHGPDAEEGHAEPTAPG